MERVEPRGTFLSTEFTTFSPKGRIRTPIRWPESGHVANLEVDLSRRPPGPEPDATFSRNPLKTWRFQVLRNQSLSLKLVESYPWVTLLAGAARRSGITPTFRFLVGGLIITPFALLTI